jgi:hypothetical protein
MDFYLGFIVENAAPNMMFTIGVIRGDGTSGSFWKGYVNTNSPTIVFFPTIIHGRLNATKPSESFVYWYIGVLPSLEAIGETYGTATLTFKACDSPTG